MDFISDRCSALCCGYSEMVVTFFKRDHPAQTSGGKILAVTLFNPAGASVQKQLGAITIGIDLHHFLLAFIAPPDWPGVTVDMDHRFVGPIGLKDVITFFG